ncbi:MAG: hypothetical protein O9301_07045 [Leptospira sp.]|nr:hypothetical protein [Leptospira sp.]
MNPLIWDFWKKAGPENARDTLRFLCQTEYLEEYLEILFEVEELREYFVRYLWILREEAEIVQLLNRKDLPTQLIIQFLIFGFGSSLEKDQSSKSAYHYELVKQISPEQSVRILLDSSDILKDVYLRILLVANLDAVQWDFYFNQLEESDGGIAVLVKLFEPIPESETKAIFFNNTSLYQYIRMILVMVNQDNPAERMFFERISLVLEEIRKWESFVKEMKEFFPFGEESKLPPQERNPNRLSILLHELSQLDENDQEVLLEYFYQNQLILDNQEKLLMRGVLKNYGQNQQFFV